MPGKSRPSLIAHKKKRKSRKYWRIRQWKQGNRTCGICGLEIPDLFSSSVDHIVPLSKGGLNHHSNYQMAHIRCNTLKADKHDGDSVGRQIPSSG